MARKRSDDLASTVRDLQAHFRYRHRLEEVFRDLIDIYVLTFRNANEPRGNDWDQREARYMSHVAKYGGEAFDLFARLLGLLRLEALSRHGDLLGELFMGLELGSSARGQFFTPFHVSRLMAAIALEGDKVADTIAQHGFITLGEPTCGAGGMIIAAAAHLLDLGYNPAQHMLVTAQDVDPVCVGMTYLSLTLYDIPGVVVEGNSMTDERRSTLMTPALLRAMNEGRCRKQPEREKYADPCRKKKNAGLDGAGRADTERRNPASLGMD